MNKNLISELLGEEPEESLPESVSDIYAEEPEELPIGKFLEPFFDSASKISSVDSKIGKKAEAEKAMDELFNRVITYAESVTNRSESRNFLMDALLMDIANDLKNNGHLLSFDRKLALLDTLGRIEKETMKPILSMLNSKGTTANIQINNNLPNMPVKESNVDMKTIEKRRKLYELLKKTEGSFEIDITPEATQ